MLWLIDLSLFSLSLFINSVMVLHNVAIFLLHENCWKLFHICKECNTVHCMFGTPTVQYEVQTGFGLACLLPRAVIIQKRLTLFVCAYNGSGGNLYYFSCPFPIFAGCSCYFREAPWVLSRTLKVSISCKGDHYVTPKSLNASTAQSDLSNDPLLGSLPTTDAMYSSQTNG